MRDRIGFWLRALRSGVKPLDAVARWIAVAVLLLGIAGITVTFVFHLPWPLIVVILIAILLAVVAEGAYRVWHETNQARLSAQVAWDAATQDLEDQRRAHEKSLAAAQAGYEARLAAMKTERHATPPPTGLEVVITKETPTPFPGLALILEVEYAITNHDAMEHMLSVTTRGPFFPSMDKQDDPEYLKVLHAYGQISDRRRREAPPRVRPGETVHGVYVGEFAWNPARYLPDYTLIVSDGRHRYEARPGRTGKEGPEPLEPCYMQREPYRLPNANMVHHRIGIRNPAGSPEATGVRLQWTEMSPRPRTDLGFPPVIPQAVPMQAGGDPTIGIPLPSGQEELWVLATTATDEQGVMTVGVFGPGRFGWHGTPWHFEPHDRWRFTYRIVADNLPPVGFSVVMTAEDGQIRCDLEG